jgi:hypothetical protein
MSLLCLVCRRRLGRCCQRQLTLRRYQRRQVTPRRYQPQVT